MRVALFVLLAAVLATLSFAQLSPQRDAFHGRYYSHDCMPWGTPAAGITLTARHFNIWHNNGYVSRVNIYVNSPTCTGGFNIELTKFGVLNFDIGAVTNTVGATNVDFGQDFKMLYAVDQVGATALNTLCPNHGPRDIRPMEGFPADRLDCPNIWVVPFEACPMHYSIGKLTGNQLQTAVPSCDVASRPTTFGTTLATMTRETQMPFFMGLWQAGECFYDPARGHSFSSELQILPEGFYSLSFYGYTGPNCVPANLGVKGTMGGMLETLQPNYLVPTAYDVEMDRMAHTLYITSPQMLQDINNRAAAGGCGLTFQLNVLADLRNVTCPALNMTSVRDCPKLYEIMSVQSEKLFFGRPSHQSGSQCVPANRPHTLDGIGMINLIPFTFGGATNVGAVVVLVLLIVALVIGCVWIGFKHRGNTLTVVRNLCCGERSTYAETA